MAQAHKEAEEEREESGFELRMIIAERKNTRAGAGYDHASASSITREESFLKTGLCACVSECTQPQFKSY